jgi:PAS domain S-box-containing protein
VSDYSALQLPLSERLPIVTIYTNLFCPAAQTVWMTPQVERLTGYRVEDWVGNPGFFEQVLHPDDRRPVLEDVRASRDERRAFSRDYRLIARDGRVVWIHDESVPILDDEGRPELIQGYFIDITERKQLEQQLLHAQKSEALGRLAGEVAHDFNNHLMAVRGHAEFLGLALPEEAEAQTHVREIVSTTGRAAKLTHQLLAFSRREPPAPQALEIDEVVRGLELMLASVAGEGVQIVLELRGTPVVHADLSQLEQVIVNLVANARDAMPSGGLVSIRTYATTLNSGTVTERLGLPPGSYAVLVVADNGSGMDAETQSRVFDPFFTTKERERGTGLGLSIVDSVIRQSGGAIEVQSAPGRSRFRILLPVAPVG